MPQYVVSKIKRVSQGDIYKGLEVYETHDPDDPSGPVKTHYGYAIVLSQECDLDRDWKNYRELQQAGSEVRKKHDKLLRQIILAPCYPFEMFLEGKHIKDRKMADLRGYRQQIQQNNHKRFHFLPKQEGMGLPNLAIDFKHYFTVDRGVFYRLRSKPAKYVCSLNALYREELSRRFAAYQARIGLPEDVEDSSHKPTAGNSANTEP